MITKGQGKYVHVFSVKTKTLQEMSKMLKTQELQNARQATVISRLEEALINDRKCKPEVLEAGKFV